MKTLVVTPESKFVKISCKNCKNEQTVFNKSATLVKCIKCGEVLVEPTGGESIIKGKTLQVLS